MPRSALAVALGAALVAALAAGCGEATVLEGVREAEANRALAALDRAGIAADKARDETRGEGGSWSVRVGAAEVARAVAVLGDEALPRREEPGFEETWGAGSLVQTEEEQRARAAQSVSGELARTLEAIDGVLDARVHVALTEGPDVTLDPTTRPRPTASVLLKYSTPRAPYDDAEVRRLVAGAVRGLRPEDVAVVGIRRAPSTARPGPGLARVGPVAVARESAGTLRGLLALLLSSNLLLALGLIWRVRAGRRG